MYFRFIMTSYIVLTVVVLDNDGLVDNNDNDVDNDGIPDFRDNDPRADKLEHEIPREGYWMAESNENCPEGQIIATVSECKVASAALGRNYHHEVEFINFPAGCYGYGTNQDSYFNAIISGESTSPMVNTVGICKRDNWNGPTDKVWTSPQCRFQGYDTNLNLEQCKIDCRVTVPRCNSINWSPRDKRCEYLACPEPVPYPATQYPLWEGYYYNSGPTSYDLVGYWIVETSNHVWHCKYVSNTEANCDGNSVTLDKTTVTWVNSGRKGTISRSANKSYDTINWENVSDDWTKQEPGVAEREYTMVRRGLVSFYSQVNYWSILSFLPVPKILLVSGDALAETL